MFITRITPPVFLVKRDPDMAVWIRAGLLCPQKIVHLLSIAFKGLTLVFSGFCLSPPIMCIFLSSSRLFLIPLISFPFPVFICAGFLQGPLSSKVPPVMVGAEWLLRELSLPWHLVSFLRTRSLLLPPLPSSKQPRLLVSGEKSIKLDECYQCIAACKIRIMLASSCRKTQ